MAAPTTMTPNPLPMQSPSNKPTSTSSPSAETAKRDQERVTLLLEINQLLLQEIVTLQEAGKGGDVQSPAKTGEAKAEGEKNVASQEFVEYVHPDSNHSSTDPDLFTCSDLTTGG